MLKVFVRRLVRADRPIFALLQSMTTQVITLVVNIATGILTARLLGPEGRGIFTAVTLWPQLLASLASAGLGNALVYHLRRDEALSRAITGAGLLLLLVGATLSVVIGFIVVPWFLARYDSAIVLFAQLCLLGTYTNTVQVAAKQAFVGLGAFGLYNLSNFLPQLFYLAGLLLVIAITSLSPEAAALSLIIGGFVALLAVMPSFVRLARPTLADARAEIGKLASYAARAAGTDLITAIANYGDRLILIPLVPSGELGFYVVAYSFSRIILIVQPALNSVVFSSMAQRDRNGVKVLHDYAFRFALYGLAAIVAVLTVVGRPVLTVVYGQEFAAATLIFQILVLEAALTCLAAVTVQLYFALDRPGFVSIVQTVSFALSVGSVLYLVPAYGALGAAWGMLIAAVARLVLLQAGVWSQLRLPLPRLYLTRSDFSYLWSRLT